MPRGYHHPLLFLPFDHCGSFETNMFAWKGDLNEAQTAEIARRYREFVDIFEKAGSVTVTKTAA